MGLGPAAELSLTHGGEPKWRKLYKKNETGWGKKFYIYNNKSADSSGL